MKTEIGSSLASGRWLTSERIRLVGAVSALGGLCLLGWLLVTSRGTLDWLGRPLGTDFSNVWAAGRMVLDGRAAEAWDWPEHFAVQRAIHGPGTTEVYAWHYPPPFLLVAALLAMLPYGVGLVAWQAATLGPFVWMIQRLVPGRDSLLLTVAAPVTLVCLTHGQNGFLTALLLGGGLMLLDRRPWVAGLLFGCLIYKPQFVGILPILLLAGGHWRAIGGALISAALLVAATLALWGWPVWQAFLDSLPLTRTAIIEQGATGFHKIMSPFAAARLWGASVAIASVVQMASAVAAVAAVIVAARRTDRPWLRNSIVCAAAVISTPYALDYDLVVLLPALAWLYLDGRRHGFRAYDLTLMALVWIAPLFARAAAQFALIPLGLVSAVAVATIAIRRLTRPERDDGRSHSPESTAAGRAATAQR